MRASYAETTIATLTIRLKLNPDFDRGFPRSKSLIMTNMRIEEGGVVEGARWEELPEPAFFLAKAVK